MSAKSTLPLKLSVRLPNLLFVEYRRAIHFRLENEGQRPVQDLAIQVGGSCVGREQSACRGLLHPQTSWEGRCEFTPDEAGDAELKVSIKLRRSPLVEEIWVARFDRQVRAKPEKVGDLRLAIEGGGFQIGEKAFYNQMVDGNVNLQNQVVVDARNLHRDMQTLLDEMDRATSWVEAPFQREKAHALDFTNSFGMKMRAVPQGRFRQGSPEGEKGRSTFPCDEEPREVHMDRLFWIGIHEVTQKQWSGLMDCPGCRHDEHAGEWFPANGMTWFEAREFCKRLTDREHGNGRLPRGLHYRLPTEAEWEYCCRAGSQEARYGDLNKVAVVGMPLTEIGSRMANDWGLHDMLGNVFEWCLDAYREAYSQEDFCDPFVPGNARDKRVVRGGCFQGDPRYARAASRCQIAPDSRSGRIGLRVVVSEADLKIPEIDGAPAPEDETVLDGAALSPPEVPAQSTVPIPPPIAAPPTPPPDRPPVVVMLGQEQQTECTNAEEADVGNTGNTPTADSVDTGPVSESGTRGNSDSKSATGPDAAVRAKARSRRKRRKKRGR